MLLLFQIFSLSILYDRESDQINIIPLKFCSRRVKAPSCRFAEAVESELESKSAEEFCTLSLNIDLAVLKSFAKLLVHDL